MVWRLRCSNTRFVCAVGSRNGTEETKLMVLDFDVRKAGDDETEDRKNMFDAIQQSVARNVDGAIAIGAS